MLFKSKYDSDITFAFDNISDYKIIEEKLKMIRRHTNKQCIFYVLTGFDWNDKYDEDFWYQDIIDAFIRIELIIKYGCVPYIMRFERYKESPNYGMYVSLARWCNQPSMLKKKSFREFSNMRKDSERYMNEFLSKYSNFDQKYIDMKFAKWE